MKKPIFILLFLFILIGTATAQVKGKVTQQPRPGNVNQPPVLPNIPSPGNTTFNQQDSAQVDSLPTFEYKYFLMDLPQVKKIEGDTNLGNFFKDVDAAKRRRFNAFNTGNNGSAMFNPIFTVPVFTGFHTGYHQYDDYNYTLNNLPFFDSERTLADMYFSQIVGNQGNFEVGAKYGQKFDNNVSMSINYRRIFQQGIYNNQTTKTTNFSSVFRFRSLKNKIQNTLGLIVNNNNENHLGGVLTDLSSPNEVLRLNVPVALNEANTRYAFDNYFLISEYSLTKQTPDSSSSSVGFKFDYKSGYHRYADKSLDDNAYEVYNRNPLDARGIRNFVQHNTLSGEFYLKGNFNFFKGKLGLLYDLHKLKDNDSESINDITLFVKGVTNIKNKFLLNTEARLGVGENVGTFYINGNTDLNITKGIRLHGRVEFFNSQKAYNDENLFLNGDVVYKKDISNQIGNQLYGSLFIDKIKTEVFVGQLLVNNYIYRLTNGEAANNSELVSNTYFGFTNRLKAWRIHFDNSAFVQAHTSKVIGLPKQMLKSDLYYEGKHFKKVLTLRLGVEYIHIPSFRLNSYYPITGHYYLGLNEENSTYQNLDLYLNAQVSRFRLFVKWENYLDVLNGKVNYLVSKQPQFDNNIRFGVRWLFLD